MAMNFFRKNEVLTQNDFEEFTNSLSLVLANNQKESETRMQEHINSMTIAIMTKVAYLFERNTYQKEELSGFVAEKVSGLGDEKKGNEIIATLLGKMISPHPSKLRSFYTDAERKFKKPLSELHKKRVENLTNRGDGKFPYRKIDTVLMTLDADEVFSFAKAYTFKTK